MQRVVIIGSPGAGKSTFARALAQRTGLPLVHLDAEYWQAGWVEPDQQQWDATLGHLLEREHWIMDGNYGGSMDRRLARADTAILLDYPTWLCLWRVVRRVLSLRGRTRPDMAPDCPERFDLAFLLYVAKFRWAKTPALERRLAGYSGSVVRFRRPADAALFLDRLA